MTEWKALPRSIRMQTHEVSLDVWPVATDSGREYRYTVLDCRSQRYLASGSAFSQESACELAMKAGRI